MPQKNRKLILCAVLVAFALAVLAVAASGLLETGGSASTDSTTSAAPSEPLRQEPCGSTKQGGPEGPAMSASDTCTGYALTTGPVTEPAIQDPDRYAWRTFCELNQPARGDGRERVWQTWANQIDLFVSRPDPKHPPTWAQATGSTRRDRMQRRVELVAALLSRESTNGGGSTSSSTTSTTSTSNLPKPPYDADSCDPNTMQQVFINRAQFDYVVSNNLWYIEGQVAAYKAQKAIHFPTDATTVKALWRPIEPADKAKYFWTVSDGKLYGLASFLFMSKVIPTWTWASFEHMDNPCFARYEAPQDNFGVTASGQPSSELLKMFQTFGLDPALWSHYKLGGIQTSFTNTTGRPVLLGNSIAEAGFQTTSSCTTCHARSTVGPHTSNVYPAAGRLPVFGGGFYAGNGRLQSSNGAPDPSLYSDFSTTPSTSSYLQMDFAWSFSCANAIGSDSDPCVPKQSSN
ncbi:MAG TPA: hypothetical protein VEZ11_09960 [Thermoanaerobaculia bacterium]|nr:hypothetical protein [Thermoanaerobaculia bacterium]